MEIYLDAVCLATAVLMLSGTCEQKARKSFYLICVSYSCMSSGLVVPETKGNETIPEVVTTSGYALLHFFSDAAYNLTGFNIFFS